MNLRRMLLSVTLVVTIGACSGSGGSAGSSDSAAPSPSVAPSPAVSASPAAEAIDLTVYGAASLKGALEAVKAAYAAAVPGVTLTVATDASSTLRTQIEQGAPADVFLSADQTNPTKLEDAGLADGAAVAFAGNSPAIIVPAANPAHLSTPADLARPGVKIVAAGADVPISAYAEQQIALLGALPGYPANFADGYRANVVSKEQNVSAVVAKIELGEGDAAIVYATDAKASTSVREIPIPSSARLLATYGGVVVKDSAHLVAAHAFLDWLAGPHGAAVLGPFGFYPAP
jgi:molybdate transport system substrate-binding protein